MMNDPAVVLRLLFAIPASQIARDVAEGERDFDKLMEDGLAYHLEQHDSKDSHAAARFHHQQMVRANVIHSREDVAEEYRLFYVSMAATGIAEEAVMAAHETGRLAELGRSMNEIEKREGLQDR